MDDLQLLRFAQQHMAPLLATLATRTTRTSDNSHNNDSARRDESAAASVLYQALYLLVEFPLQISQQPAPLGEPLHALAANIHSFIRHFPDTVSVYTL